MNRLLIRSDHLSIRSDGHSRSFAISSAQASSQFGARPATAREGVTRVANRDLQTLWPAKLPLRRRAGARAEAISCDQSAWRATAPRLCAERRLRAGCPPDRQLPQATRSSQRDLCNQCRASAPARGSRVDRDGPCPRCPRFRQGGRHSRRHGCVLSRCWRLAVRSGEGQ
jgi:hypothetical protein